MAFSFSVTAINGQIDNSAPLAVRGFLLVLVACLHIAAAMAFSRLPEPGRYDEAATILRASWIESPASVSPLSAPSPAMQSAEPQPVVRPTQARRRASPRVPAPSPRQTAAIQSAPAPATVETPAAVPVESAVSEVPVSGSDISAAVARTQGGTASGTEEDGNGNGVEGRDYVAPDWKAGYLSNPKPEYPSWSVRQREQGLVRLRVHVTVQGRPDEIMLHKSSGSEWLDKAALKTVWRWRFRPAQRAGTPVAGWVVVPVRFELQD